MGKQREKELEKLKQTLLLERQKLIEHMMRLQNASTDEIAQLSGDAADIASIEISQAALHKLGSREQKLLKKIDHALKKFENGTYGICEHTGEEIPIPRLQARPVAQYTVEAKTELERRERQFKDDDEPEEESSFG